MATLGLIEYDAASPEVRAVYDDIMATRKTDWINNFWKAIAHDSVTLRRTWLSVKEIMAPGALDAANEGDALPGRQHQQPVRLLHRVAYCRSPQSRHDGRHVGRTDGRRRDGERNEQTGKRVSSRD